jgi:ribosome recycling factor
MSAIGEARGFGKTADEISKKLKTDNLTPEERAKLEKDLEWYANESRFCWSAARQDAMVDEARDREPVEFDCED